MQENEYLATDEVKFDPNTDDIPVVKQIARTPVFEKQ